MATWFDIRRASGREKLGALAVLVIVAVAAAVLFLRNPSSIAALPSCPSKTVLGLVCPGCGSTRAVHHALHLRIGDAWRHNPAAFVLGLPVLAMLAVDVAAVLVAGKRITPRIDSRVGYALAAGLLGYMVVRNLPFPVFDALRPPAPAEVATQVRATLLQCNDTLFPGRR